MFVFNAIMNHLIQQNPKVQKKLLAFKNQTFIIQFPFITVRALVNSQGFLVNSELTPETQIEFKQSAIEKLIQGVKPGVGDMLFSGNQTLGIAILTTLSELNYYLNQDMVRFLGEHTAEEIAEPWQLLNQMLAEGKQAVQNSFKTYIEPKNKYVMALASFYLFSEAIATLRDDVARLEARLALLENKLGQKH